MFLYCSGKTLINKSTKAIIQPIINIIDMNVLRLYFLSFKEKINVIIEYDIVNVNNIIKNRSIFSISYFL